VEIVFNDYIHAFLSCFFVNKNIGVSTKKNDPNKSKPNEGIKTMIISKLYH